jgi:hypothetical protein
MGIQFKSPLALSAHRAIAHSDSAQTLEVKVAVKTAAHPEFGNGSSNGYVIDGVEGAYLEFTPGNTYKFDQSDNSNTGHPLRFYQDAAKTTAYTTGITTSGTPGNSGAYTQIIPSASTPPILYYQCSAHALMGSYTKFGTGSQGDTYTLSATQDGDNVDILLDAGSGTDSTVQLTAGNNITLTRSNAQEIEIASSGGGGTEVTVQKNIYTANGSTTTFNTSTAIANKNNVQVYINGVYQSKDNYTTSGSTVTFSTAPPNATSVELIHMVAVNGVIVRDDFTGNGSITAFLLSMSITNENATQVYIDGVYQSKDNYTTSASTLTFSTAPPSGAAIEVVHIKAVDASSLNQNSFTGNGSTTAFTLSQSVDDENKTFVFIQGIYQEKSTYSIAGNTITFLTAPQSGYTVEIMAFTAITVGNSLVTSVNGQTGNVTVSGATVWQPTIKTASFTAVASEGYFVNTTSGEITVTLPAGTVGAELTIQDYAGTFATNKVILNANGSEKILGSAIDGRININNATAVLIYQDATQGWTSPDIELNLTTISWATPTGQSLTYSTPSPQSSIGVAAATFPTTTFTATVAGGIISGTATIAGLPSGITAAQTITGSGAGNTLTVTLTGTFPTTNSLNTALTLSGLSVGVGVEYLVVAGGGAGGNGMGGGGGAGGLIHNYGGTPLSMLAATNYNLTVGAGASGTTSNTRVNGSDSTFSSLTAIGGGGGSSLQMQRNVSIDAGAAGGSGGGSSSGDPSPKPTNGAGGAAQQPTSASGGYGNRGGNNPGNTQGQYPGGGGGGAGAAGGDGIGPNGAGGAGGIGLQVDIDGNNYYWAAGGGGDTYTAGTAGSGGLGGGGGGSAAAGSGTPGSGGGSAINSGTSGTVGNDVNGGAAGANTGSGGGGASWSTGAGGNGGSGIVILRYPNTYTISGLSGTTTTVGTDKVTTFTAGTGNIQFN